MATHVSGLRADESAGVRAQSVCGARAIPDAMIATPLKADFEQQLRSCRLEKSTHEKTLELDLREAAHLRKSQFLHRLTLLELPWGKTAPPGSNKQGRFHENWQLKWLPDYEIRLIEAGVWGSTVAEASNNRARRQVRDSEQPFQLPVFMEPALFAGSDGRSFSPG